MIKKQFGMTLIELTIGMMLGLALVASIGQLFSQSQKSFRLQKNLSDMTDDATFMLETLAKGILLAGYAEDANRNFGFSSNTILGSTLKFDTAQCDDGCEFIKGDNNSLIYRFKYSGNSILAVIGNGDELYNFVGTSSLLSAATPPTPNDIITVYIYKENDANGTPVLYSRVSNHTAPTNPAIETPAIAIPNAQPLISDVEKLEFRYGIQIKYCDDKPNPTNKPCPTPSNKRTPEDDQFYYTTAENITDWNSVFAIKVFLVMRSAEKNLTRNNKTGWQIGDTTTEYPTVDEGRIYKVFSKTIYLRATAQ